MYKRNGMEYAVYVNEEKGIVTVKITNAVEQLVNEFAMFCQKNEIVFDGAYFEAFCKKYEKQMNKLIGFATCNKEAGDEFNVEYGYKLAHERAMAYFEAYRTKFYTGLCMKYDNIAEAASIRAEESDARHWDRVDRVSDIIDELKQ